jgi:hypothetical protein
MPAGTTKAYGVDMSAIPESEDTEEGQKYRIVQNNWSLKAPSDAPASLWFVVYVYDGEWQRRYFVTTSVSSAATVSLDINAMTEVN